LLPIVGAVGGFLVPTRIYAAINWNAPQVLHGWAIPSTTDIAFVVGICAVLGRAAPAPLKAFLLALAITDDLLAIIVIAVFYTDELSTLSIELAFLGVAALVVLNVLVPQTWLTQVAKVRGLHMRDLAPGQPRHGPSDAAPLGTSTRIRSNALAGPHRVPVGRRVLSRFRDPWGRLPEAHVL